MTYLQEHPDVALVGPKLLDPDGSPQSSRRRFPASRSCSLRAPGSSHCSHAGAFSSTTWTMLRTLVSRMWTG